jgi:hypothetical protein
MRPQPRPPVSAAHLAGFLAVLDTVRAAIPPSLETFNAVMAALEHVAFRLAILGLTMYGLYHALSP